MEFDENDKFFIEKVDRVNSLVNARNRFLSKLNSKVRELQEEIEKPAACEKQWIYAKSCLVHDFNISGNSIAFDLYVSPTGWELQLFGRNQSSNNYVTQLVSKRSDHTTEKGRLVVARWPLSTELAEIKDKLCEWLAWIVQEDANKSLNTDAARLYRAAPVSYTLQPVLIQVAYHRDSGDPKT